MTSMVLNFCLSQIQELRLLRRAIGDSPAFSRSQQRTGTHGGDHKTCGAGFRIQSCSR